TPPAVSDQKRAGPPPTHAQAATAKFKQAHTQTSQSTKRSPPTRADTKATTSSARLERKAVDRLVGGRYQDAIRLYRRLASMHPKRPVFATVADLLRQRPQVPEN
ncbi:MAG: hypothetical protein ACPGUV_11250, partial [Polyangiales bacterium]